MLEMMVLGLILGLLAWWVRRAVIFIAMVAGRGEG